MDREKERQHFVKQVLSSHEDERKVISQELHDGLIQELFVMGNTLRTLEQRLTDSIDLESASDLQSLMYTTDQLIKETRGFCLDLRPHMLDDIGFLPSLKWLANRLNNKDTNIVPELIIEGTTIELPKEIETTVFRIMQEAITNIIKHSNATKASIFIRFGKESLDIEVQDNGKGFIIGDINKLSSTGKLGVAGMQQRVQSISGIFNIQSYHDKGTNINITLPIAYMVKVIR